MINYVKQNPEIIVMGISLLISILTPILTSIINVVHETRMYKRRFYIEHKAEVIEKYISSTGKRILSADSDYAPEYGQHYGEALIYVNKETADKMLELHSILNPYSYDGKKAVDIFNSICNDLRKNPPRVK